MSSPDDSIEQRVSDMVVDRVLELLAEHERKLHAYLDKRFDEMHEEFSRTRGNSKHLADGLMRQGLRVEEIARTFAEGHEQIGAAHGHMAVKFRSILSQRESIEPNGNGHE